jgi:hypothetical protein
MDDELHLQPVETRDALRSSAVITLATLVGHLIPLLPFVWLVRTQAVVVAIALSALVYSVWVPIRRSRSSATGGATA